MSKESLPGGYVGIRVNEATSNGIIIAGLEVVQPGLGVIDIAAVTERILCSQGACERAGAGKQSAPTVVRVFYYRVVVAVNEADDVVLPVADIVVIRTVVVHGDHIAVCIVAEQQRIRARHLRDQHRAVVAVLRRRAVDHLLGSQPVLIIGIGGRGRAVRRARQPPSLQYFVVPRLKRNDNQNKLNRIITANTISTAIPTKKIFTPSRCQSLLYCIVFRSGNKRKRIIVPANGVSTAKQPRRSEAISSEKGLIISDKK